MSQRSALILATGLSAFILVVAVALAGRLATGAAPAAEFVAAAAPAGPTAAGEREAAYQQTISEANRRLAEAYQREQQLAAQAAPAVASPVSAEQAVTIATDYLGGQALGVKQRNQRGLAVYAVTMSDGSVVYVDVASGQVAYIERGGPAGGGEGEEPGEHSEEGGE